MIEWKEIIRSNDVLMFAYEIVGKGCIVRTSPSGSFYIEGVKIHEEAGTDPDGLPIIVWRSLIII